MKFEKNKKNLIAIGVVASVVGFGSIGYAIFSKPAKPRVLIPAPPLEDTIPNSLTTNKSEPISEPHLLNKKDEEKEPVTLDLSFTLPMSKDAQQILDFSRDLSIQTVRALALAEKAKGDKFAGINQPKDEYPIPTMPVMVPELNDNNSSEPAEPESIISEQVTVRGILRVDGNLSAIIGLGNQIVPVRVGTKFNGVSVINLTDTSITLSEGKKKYTRYLNKQVQNIKSNNKKGV